MAYVSGGAGLWSTLNDYLAFARMFMERGRRGWRAAVAAGDACADDLQPPDRQPACQVRDVWAPHLRRGSRVRNGSCGGARAREGRADAVRWRRGRGGLAGRLRRLVAGRSQRRLRADLPGAQHGRARAVRWRGSGSESSARSRSSSVWRRLNCPSGIRVFGCRSQTSVSRC